MESSRITGATIRHPPDGVQQEGRNPITPSGYTGTGGGWGIGGGFFLRRVKVVFTRLEAIM